MINRVWDAIKRIYRWFVPQRPVIDPRIKYPLSVWLIIFLVGLFVIFFILSGYIYVVQLGMPDNKEDALKREELILNEIFWADKWRSAFESQIKIDLDTASKYFIQSVDLLDIHRKQFTGMERFFEDSLNLLRTAVVVNGDTIKEYLIRILNDTTIKNCEDTVIISRAVGYSLYKQINDSLARKNYKKFIKHLMADSITYLLILDYTIRNEIINSLQQSFENQVFACRYNKWHPSLKSARKKLCCPILLIFLFLVTVVIFALISNTKHIPSRPLKSTRVIMYITILWIFATYMIMIISGRINPSRFPLFKWMQIPVLSQYSHLVILIFIFSLIYVFIIFKFKNRKDQETFLEWYDKILFTVITTISIIFLYMIIKAFGQELPGIKFIPHEITKQIAAFSQKILLIGLEIGIGAMILILALIYIFFPMVMREYFGKRKPEKLSKINILSGEFWRWVFKNLSEFLGWGSKYQYFLKEIIEQNSTSVILGLMGSIFVLLVPFLFSSVSYYSSHIFIKFINCITQRIPWTILVVAYLLMWLCCHWKRVDIRSRHWQILLPILIVLIILKFWYPKTTIDKIPFFVFRLQLRTQLTLYFELLTSSIPAVLPLIVLWLAPIIKGLNNPVNIITARTTSILQKVLLELKNHTVLFGYGDLGFKVGSGIVKRYIKPSLIRQIKGFEFAEIFSTRRDEILKVCKNIVVLDKAAQVFDETYTEPVYFGTIGLCDVEIPIPSFFAKTRDREIKIAIEKYPNDVVLVGIVGDCKEPAIHDKVNLSDSQSIILAVRDNAATFPVFNEVYKLHIQKKAKNEAKRPRAIIGTESSLYGAYLEWRCVDEAIYFVYPAQLRGIVVGEVVSGDMINQGLTKNSLKNKKVLIIGSGNKLYYILHTISEDLKRFFEFSKDEAENFLMENVSIISNEEFIEKNSIINLRTKKIRQGKWRIKASATGLLENPARDLFIPVVLEKPSDATILQTVIEGEKPIIIVVAAMSTEETAAITHEVLLTLERINRNKQPANEVQPHIIVGTRRIEWHQVRDALACWRLGKFINKSNYPIQGVDSVIDYYDDAAQMMLGLYETIQPLPNGDLHQRNLRPIELSVCTTDTPGYLAQITADLVGSKFVVEPSQLKGSPVLVPNFHNYRSVNVKYADFTPLVEGGNANWTKNLGYCFFSGATLIKNKSIRDIFEQELQKQPRSCIVGAVNDNDRKLIDPRLENLFKKQGCLMEGPDDCFVKKQCPKRRLCPLDIFRRHLKVAPKEESRVAHYRCNHQDITQAQFSVVEYQSYAQIALCGYGSENPGAMARAINLLLYRDKIDSIDFGDSRPSDSRSGILDVMYTRSFGCYCSKRSYNKIYGQLISTEEMKIKKEELKNRLKQNSFINALLIRPTHVDSRKDWVRYLIQVWNLLPDKERYRIWVGCSKVSTSQRIEIILLFRYNEDYFNEATKELEKIAKRENKQMSLKLPDIFLYLLRGYQVPKFFGRCMVRETTCPFEKIRDEAERYNIVWKDVTPSVDYGKTKDKIN